MRDEAEHKGDSEAVGIGASRCRDAESVEQAEEIRIADATDLFALLEGERDEYRRYLDAADELADGPSIRIAQSALRDKERQVGALSTLELGDGDPARDDRYFLSSFYDLSPELGWEFTAEAARWLYDETRHMLMGKERLEAWALPAETIPLGGYIYEARRRRALRPRHARLLRDQEYRPEA